MDRIYLYIQSIVSPWYICAKFKKRHILTRASRGQSKSMSHAFRVGRIWRSFQSLLENTVKPSAFQSSAKSKLRSSPNSEPVRLSCHCLSSTWGALPSLPPRFFIRTLYSETLKFISELMIYSQQKAPPSLQGEKKPNIFLNPTMSSNLPILLEVLSSIKANLPLTWELQLFPGTPLLITASLGSTPTSNSWQDNFYQQWWVLGPLHFKSSINSLKIGGRARLPSNNKNVHSTHSQHFLSKMAS